MYYYSHPKQAVPDPDGHAHMPCDAVISVILDLKVMNMPMSDETKKEAVQRLQTAHKKTKDMLENEPVTRELHPGTDIARNWTVVTATYSGLEQTLKYLIADEKGLTIEELFFLTPADANLTNEGGTSKHPFRTHNLNFLFQNVESETREIVRDFYRRFQSLYSYLTIAKVDEFLSTVSGRQGTGYERWRYTLIEDKPLPKNSPEALLTIWGVCVQVAVKRLWKNQRVRMPEQKLAEGFCQRLESTVTSVSVDRQDAGEPFQDISRERRDWLWSRGHPLNAFAEALWRHSRHGTHGAEGVSEWFSDALTRWAEEALQNPAAAKRTSLHIFMARAQGHTTEGASIRWDPKENRFKPVPWSLEECFLNAPPPQATVIGDPTRRGGTPFASLWVAAAESGYQILENRAFNGPPDENYWFRTLQVQAEDASNVRPVLSIWQKRGTYHNLFYMVEESAQEEMAPPIRRWVDLAMTLGEMRSGRRLSVWSG